MQHIETTYHLAGWVHMGDYLMPAGWVARVDDPAYPYVAELRVLMEDGGDYHPVCTAITLTQREGGPPIESARMRLPITQILKQTAASVALRALSGDDGRWAPVGEDDLERFFRVFHTREHPPGRRRVDDERLRAVAHTYKGATPAGSPIEAVRLALTISRRQAERLVAMARRRTDPDTGQPFLAPYTRPDQRVSPPVDRRSVPRGRVSQSEEKGEAP